MATKAADRIVVRVDAEFLDLCRVYLANRTKEVGDIEAALQRHDFETIHRMGHNMHGSGCMFGFDELTVTGAELQRAAAAGDSAEIMRLRRSIGEFVSRVELKAEPTQCAHTVTPRAKADGAASLAFKTHHVLLADDDEMNRILVSRYLEKEGYTVRQVSSGDDALAALKQPPLPAMILLDVVMSGMSGFDVCRELKANPGTRAIPVVLITGLDKNEDRLRGREAGADAFLTKPVARRDLLAWVCALVRREAETATAPKPRFFDP